MRTLKLLIHERLAIRVTSTRATERARTLRISREPFEP